MSKIRDFWKAHTNADGKLVWPDDAASREDLARKLFGTCFVDALDYWLAHADDLIENPSPPSDEPWRRKTEDPTLRATFANMSEEQRNAVRMLVRSTVQGTLFSTLVGVDQNPTGHFEVKLVDGGEEYLVHNVDDELHDELYDWVWQFSAYAELLMIREKTARFDSVRWKASGERQDGSPRT